jgi:hypothetical protein
VDAKDSDVSKGGVAVNMLEATESGLGAVSRSDYLLDVAAQTFLQQGFEGTSAGEITSRSRLQRDLLQQVQEQK